LGWSDALQTPNVLAALGGNMLGELPGKSASGGRSRSIEELALGGEGDRSGLAILLDADLLQRQRGTGDILGQGFPSLIREIGDRH
jgi:hypothetical protein